MESRRDNLPPLVWCHMAGMLMMWGDLFQKTTSIGIWHHIYHLEPVRRKPGLYYVTRHAKGRDMLVEGLPTSYGDWRMKWFFLDVASYGPRLQRHYRKARVF